MNPTDRRWSELSDAERRLVRRRALTLVALWLASLALAVLLKHWGLP
jgi:hypothetical protein